MTELHNDRLQTLACSKVKQNEIVPYHFTRITSFPLKITTFITLIHTSRRQEQVVATNSIGTKGS
jgi:hypothetical protein